MRHSGRFVGELLLATLIIAAAAAAARATHLHAWHFSGDAPWSGWWPNSQVELITSDGQSVTFRTSGSDPQITGPGFELSETQNGQWIEIDLDCSAPGIGELYFTNTTEGQYGGLRPEWRADVHVPRAGRQVLHVWPFWGSLGKIIRIRFDPPSGVTCRLFAIRIMDQTAGAPVPNWPADTDWGSFKPMHAADIKAEDGGLRVRTLQPQALIVSPVQPFDAGQYSVLKLNATCPGEHVLGLYWVTLGNPGMFGVPVELDETGRVRRPSIDLRRYPQWHGTVTHLAMAFGTFGDETLTVTSLGVEENDPAKPFLRLKHACFDRPLVRAGQSATVRFELEHAGGQALDACHAKVSSGEALRCGDQTLRIPAMRRGDVATVSCPVKAVASGHVHLTLRVDGRDLSTELLVAERVAPLNRGDYDVPEPQPVETDYTIGVYYFPGWSPEQMSRWRHQEGYPERDSLLGWYEEGRPEVADWHIKWAVENAISFFLFDWYWRDGKEQLGAGLNDGFLNARYCGNMRFALMWANHKPFSSHTTEQLLQVTDYWIDRYMRRPNYLKIDGKPYVSFFSPGELLHDLGSPEKVAEAFDAMRRRAVEAGLAGLHFAACGPTQPSGLQWLKDAGFDSVSGYNYRSTGATTRQSAYRQYLIGHEPIWYELEKADVMPYFPLLTVGWDSRPWHGQRAEARFARCTRDFEEALGRLKMFMDRTGGKVALLEAWNEWGEGSYIEPNAEFGFGDIEAIRRTFARPGQWPVNIGPGDVGLEGAYDLRRKPAAGRAADAGTPVALEGVNPAVVRGLTLRCWEEYIKVEPGQVRENNRVRDVDGGLVMIPPAATIGVGPVPLKLGDGRVQKWHGGNRLVIDPETDRRNVTPDSYVRDSLVVLDDSTGRAYRPGDDYVVNNNWGAFELVENGRLTPGQLVTAFYRVSLRRIDSLVIDGAGKVTLVSGHPSVDCPEPPALPAGSVHLANIYRPYHAIRVDPSHVYVPTGDEPDLSPLEPDERLSQVIRKLRHGHEVTIVCWGDSVTVGGDASTPERSYVGLFESMLKRRFPQAKIRVFNAGVGGSNTKQRLPDFDTEVLSHRPDLVTLEFVNDMGHPVDLLEQLYGQILDKTREAGAALMIITPHFTRPDWMDLKDGRGADSRPAVAFIRKFTKENSVPLADASRRWEQLQRIGIPYETLLRNGINHPDDRGHRLFAEEMMRFFDVQSQ